MTETTTIQIPKGAIVRTWTGWIRTTDRPAYADYLEQTGLRDYRATAGNLGAYATFRDADTEIDADTDASSGTAADTESARTEVTTVSFWSDYDAIAAFAGLDIATARFYPDDDRFLVARESTARHFEVA